MKTPQVVDSEAQALQALCKAEHLFRATPEGQVWIKQMFAADSGILSYARLRVAFAGPEACQRITVEQGFSLVLLQETAVCVQHVSTVTWPRTAPELAGWEGEDLTGQPLQNLIVRAYRYRLPPGWSINNVQITLQAWSPWLRFS